MLWRVFRAESGEVARLLLSGGYFFLVLFGYALLKPVRDAMGVERSMGDLDLLVAPDEIDRSVAALRDAGYVSDSDELFDA